MEISTILFCMFGLRPIYSQALELFFFNVLSNYCVCSLFSRKDQKFPSFLDLSNLTRCI